MSIRNVALVLSAIVVFTLPQPVLADEADHQPAPATAAGIALSPELKSLLNREMTLIQQGMMDLIPATAAGEWAKAAAIGTQIRESFILKQQLTEAQKEELLRVLPERFIEMDRNFHHAAGMLAQAAENENAEVLTFYFSRMTVACVDCHGRFAPDRFPGFVGRRGADHQH